MGYRGGGLGRSGTGISTPVSTTVRPPQCGLGFPFPSSRKKRHPVLPPPSPPLVTPSPPTSPEAPLLVRIAEGHELRRKKKRKKQNKRKEASSRAVNATRSVGARIPAIPLPPEWPGGDGQAAVLIDGIPVRFRSRDLRAHFTTWVEAGAFHCFHFKHRPSPTAPTPKAAAPRFDSRAAHPPRPCRCCVAAVRSRWIKEFILAFQDTPWVNSEGQYPGGFCRVHPVRIPTTPEPILPPPKYLSRKERREKAQKEAGGRGPYDAAVRAGELAPPPGLPQGFVGTPTRTLVENAEDLPGGLLLRLGVDREAEAKGFRWLYETHPLDDDSKIQQARAEERNDEKADLEEWDRHLAVEPRLDRGRGLGKVGDEAVFESKVDNPWDKHGAEGLVFYTDAVRWEAKKGDFDERTTDGWDVEGGLFKDVHIPYGLRDLRDSNYNKRFTDGHIGDDYKPSTVFEERSERLETEEGAMGSFRLSST